MAGRYAANKDAAKYGVFLKGHAGDALRVDRKGRPSEYVARPALTLGLAVQPEVVRGLGRIPGSRGRGLTARFLFAMPRSVVGRRIVAPPAVPESVKRAYRESVLALLGQPSDADAASDGVSRKSVSGPAGGSSGGSSPAPRTLRCCPSFPRSPC
ncbi:DUF3987 domain-containing protein [Paludisphaera mucosa]|uniref:DUF3987 domain-containing protein n=1 Tax=Paludisphaera mucosa TaxID=3030827 RepID=UPI0034A2ABF6